MKRLFTLCAMLLLSVCLFAQVPQKMNYQAVVRNASNSLVANQNVSARISILQGSATGAAVYSETHNVQTNANGLMTLEIGGGSATNGSLAAIDWANGPYFIKSEIDPEGGINYSVTTTQQLLSVPYALYAATSGNGEGPQGPQGPQGPAGQDGVTGPQGVPGPQGPAGQNGVSPTITTTTTSTGTFVVLTDANGNTQFFVPNGADGTTGPAGPQGEQGPVGPQGVPGISPTVAIQALANGNRVIITSATSVDTFTVLNGAQGIQGPQGEQGLQGEQGVAGQSAYELWQAAGNTGSVADFLASLVGAQGVPGADGRGIASVTGPVTNDLNDTYTINYSDGTTSTFVVTNGAQGLQGLQGEQGPAGYSPVVTITTLDTMRTQVTITSAEFPEGQSFIVKNGSAGAAFIQDQANWLETDASSNSYIQNKPTIPSVPTNVSAFTNDAGYITLNAIPVNVSAFTNDAGYLTSYTETDPQFNAWDKDYNDLTNRPTIPAAANNATLTIQKNGASVGTFTANASSDKSINITVPTTTSELTNNSGFITASAVPTNVSQLNNDAGYVSNNNCPTVNLCDLNNTLSTLQNTVSSLQNTISSLQNTVAEQNSAMEDLQNTISSQDSVINALNNELHPQAFACGTSTVTDHEGNVYNTVQIGDQCWTRENMRCTTSPSTGTSILEYPASSYSYTGKKAYYPNGNSSNVATYGLLYNWCAAVDTFNTSYGETSTNTEYSNAVNVTFSGNRRGICPQGWHVPSDAEWTTMTDYVKSQSEYVCPGCSETDDEWRTSCIAKALASTTGWNSGTNTCAVGNTPANNNATGFSAVPAGYCFGSYGYFGYYAYFWSATQYYSYDAYYRGLFYNVAYVNRYGYNKGYGFSVRCLRDGGVGGAPATNESGSTGSAGGNSECCNELGARVDSLQNTISDLQNTVDAQQNTISSQDSVINALNNQVNDLLPFECGRSTIKDHEGNVYNTVQIGDQCWTRENMRCTTSPSTGTTILEASPSSYSYTGKKAYYVNGSSSNTATYGLLYNWCAAVDTFNTSYGETSTNTGYSNAPSVTFGGNRRGICPVGWHIPSDAEWTQLTTYVGSQSEYRCDSNSSLIAKALASTTGWNSYSGTCCVGNNPSANNATGFSAVPAGFYYSDGYSYFGGTAVFWSATQTNSNNACYRYLDYNNASVNSNAINKYYGFSVRCLRDGGVGGAPANNESGSAGNAGGNSECCNELGARLDSLENVISSQDSVINALNNELHPFTCGTSTVTDHEGNIYHTVQIGNQCWTKENMRCKTSPSTGTTILEATPSSYYFTGKKAYYVNGSSSNTSTYGLLYNWNAAVDTFNTAYGETSTNTSYDNAVSVTFSGNRRGICPQGWHVPSDAEWTTMTDYVKSQSEYVCPGCSETDDEWRTSCIAKALASTTGWNSGTNTCAVGNTPANNNATGFSAVPAGYYDGSYYSFGDYAYFWSATQYYSYSAYIRDLGYDDAYVGRSYPSKNYGFSVRCLRDGGVGGAPATNESGSTGNAGGNSECCNELGARLDSLENVISSQDSVINALNNQVNDLLPFECGRSTIKDHEGNVYNTVQVGDQCWTRENMRCTTSPSTGTSILEYPASSYSYTGKKAYYPNGNSSYVATYGLLYNWCAAVDTFNTSYGETSTNTEYSNAVNVTFSGNRRGICPQGWHVPSDAEWTTMTDYVKSQSEYVCPGCSETDDEWRTSCIAKALASTTGWTSGTNTCAVGNTPANNNATGFSAVPAGYYYGSYNGFGDNAYCWSATQYLSNFAFYRDLGYGNAFVSRNNNIKSHGFSVRCLRD